MADDTIPEGKPHGRHSGHELSRRSLLGFIALSGVTLLAVLGPASRVLSQDQGLSEYEVKARYLYNFPLFVEWPERAFRSPDSPFVLGIVGHDPFGGTLDELTINRTLHRRRIVIQRLRRDQDLRQCQLLFISRSEKEHLSTILAKVAGGTVLTVSEIEGFTTTGGVIGLVFDDDRVRFEINLDNAATAGLTISAKLSSLARAVRRSASSESFRRPNAMLALDRPKRPAVL